MLHIFLSLCVIAGAQPRHTFTRYLKESGLPMTMIQDMCQDRDGYLWLASGAGLFRFNGTSFNTYKLQTGPDGVSPLNDFTRVEDDALGKLWILSGDRTLYIFDRKTGDFEKACDVDILAIYKLDQDDLCFRSADGKIIRWQYAKTGGRGRFSEYFTLPKGTGVNGIFKDASDNIWILATTGLYRNTEFVSDIPALCVEESYNTLYFGGPRGKIVEYIDNRQFVLDSRSDKDIHLIASVPGTLDLIIGNSADGVELLNLNEWKRYPIAFDSYRDGQLKCLKDKRGNIWLYSANGGLDWYDAGKRKFVPFYDRRMQQAWNSEAYLKSILSDRQGNLWISASWGGLERVIFNDGDFKCKTVARGGGNISPENSVRAIYQSAKGIIYAATRDGKVHLYDSRLDHLAEWNTVDPVYSITGTSNGRIWLGTKGGGIIENTAPAWDQTGYSPRRYRKDDIMFYGSNGDLIYCLNSQDANRLWIASFDGSISYMEAAGEARNFISKKNRISFPTDRQNRIRYIRFGPDGRLYSCGNLGLFVCDDPYGEPEKMEFRRFGKVADYDIQHLMFSSSGQMYASTSNKGLLRFDDSSEDSGFSQYTTENGLLSNTVYSSIEDRSGNIWIATYRGLNKLNPETGSIIGYSYERMGINMMFNEGEPMMSADGEIYFNTNAGLFHFNPDEISNSSFTPTIIIQSCYVSGELVDAEGGLEINSGDKIRIRFSAIDLTAPEMILYSYRIDGVDEDWKKLGNNNLVAIEDLKKGSYMLRLRSTNGDGIYVENEKDIVISVRNGLSESVKALIYFSAVLLTVLVAFLAWRRRRSRGIATEPAAEAVPEQTEAEREEQRFKRMLVKYLENNIDDGELDIARMCKEMNMSRSVLFEKTKAILGTSPIEYLRNLRFGRAAQLIVSGEYSISQIAYMTGFNDSHYFSKAFKKHFGMTPTEYRRSASTEGSLRAQG